MAELEKHDNRKDWLRWAIEFLRRGIWVGEIVTVHGPHPGASYMWGEVDGWVDWFPPTVDTKAQISNGWMSFAFRTASGIRSIYDIRGVRVWADGGENFPLLRESELSQRARRWLLVAVPLSKSLAAVAINEGHIGRRQRTRLLRA